MQRLLTRVSAVLFAVATSSPAIAASFSGLDMPPNYNSRATALSPDGSVVMGGIWAQGMPDETFRWSRAEGLTRQAGIPGWGGYARPCAMSYDGSVVVGYDNDPAMPLGHAFRWTPAGGRVYLDNPAQVSQSEASSVSWDGASVVGYRTLIGQTTPEAVLWRNGSAQPVGPGVGQGSYATGISPAGMVVGTTSGPSRPFQWTSQSGPQLMDFPQDAFFTGGPGVSADGSTIVGEWAHLGGIGEVFVWTEQGGLVGLGDLPGGASGSYGGSLSANGRIVVGTSFTGTWNPAPDLTIDTTTAFIWDAEHGTRSLPDALRTEYGLDLQGWELWEATAISADGTTIVGNGISPDGYWRTWIAEVPEPSSVLYLLLSLVLASRPRRSAWADRPASAA
jgi:uncharacterized membrane protein